MEAKFLSHGALNTVDCVGVALKQYPNRQNHVGILYASDDEPPELTLLHLSDHKRPLVDEPDERYLWMDISSEYGEIRKQVMLASIMQIAEVNADTDVRYGLDNYIYCIDPETGRLNDNYDKTIGFSCATFVVEVFLSLGIELIDIKSWPASVGEDLNFQMKALDYLIRRHKNGDGSVTREYLEAQINNLGSGRISPQEVAASTQTVTPSKKPDIQELAEKINSELSIAYDMAYCHS